MKWKSCIIVPGVVLAILLMVPSAQAARNGPAVKIPDTGPLKEVVAEPGNMSDKIDDWEARWELARVLSYVKRYPESIAEYRKVTREKPELFKARVELANVLLWSGKAEESIQELDQIPLDGAALQTKMLAAHIYAQQKRYAMADRLYSDYLKQFPEDIQVRRRRAFVLIWQGKFPDAIKELRTTLP